ncbi:MAG: dTDP-4-dehydrorhamnose reductase, partial [Myxococcota bacterium]
MKVLITGGKGMLGRTLAQHFREHEVVSVDVEDFDLRDAAATRDAIRAASPQAIVHCAAMTAVDRCESEEDLAYSVNALGSAHVAIAAHDVGARLIAISTDYVFDGRATRPYHEWDETGPRSVYGASKLAGEQAIRAHCPNHLIARIAWLYGAGGPSFVHTMLKLGAQGGEPLRVVDDQHGNPTSTDAVAAHLLQLLAVPTVGTVHLTCEGETTWFDFTRTIFKTKGFDRGVDPCATSEYPRPAPRPA